MMPWVFIQELLLNVRILILRTWRVLIWLREAPVHRVEAPSGGLDGLREQLRAGQRADARLVLPLEVGRKACARALDRVSVIDPHRVDLLEDVRPARASIS